MERIKGYLEFVSQKINEEEGDLGQKGSNSLNVGITRKLTKIVSGHKREIRAKTQSQVEEKYANRGFGTWDKSQSGFVGYSMLLNGKVVTRVLTEDDDDESLEYTILTGLNKGLKGKYRIDTEGMTVFSPPTGKEWKDLKGPDRDFWSNMKNKWEWKSPLGGLESKGIKIKEKNKEGECYLEYEDNYQFYGTVHIYCSVAGNPYVYEVKSGPNKGKKGEGFYVRGEAGETKQLFKDQGVPTLFWGEGNEKPVLIKDIEWPTPQKSIADSGIYKKNPPSPKVTGMNPSQIIFLNTSNLSVISPPQKEKIVENYGGSIFSAQRWVKKEDLKNRKTGSEKTKTIGELDKMKGNKWDGYYESSFMGNPIYLYEVNCKNPKDSSSFKWDSEDTGRYTTNYFIGLFSYTREGESNQRYDLVKGEWYWDYESNGFGLIYAYDRENKKVETIYDSKLISAKEQKAKEQKTKEQRTKIQSRSKEFGSNIFNVSGGGL
jgi:hypothetical protein